MIAVNVLSSSFVSYFILFPILPHAVCRVQFTSPFNGNKVTGVLRSSVNFTWAFNGDIERVAWGTKDDHAVTFKDVLVSIDMLQTIATVQNPPYSGRVSGNWDGNSPGQATFTLNSIQKADERFYVCQLTPKRLDFPHVYDIVQLIIAVPTVGIDGDQTQFVAIGYGLVLTCQYNASPPVFEVQWKKDGTVIARNTTVEIKDSRTVISHYNESHVQLTINTTTSHDSGNYTCIVTNDVGSSSDSAKIVLEEKPSISTHPQGDIVTEGKNITLSCDAIGSPALTISWTINGSPVNTSDNFRISFSANKTQLTITNVSRTDSGEYRCVVENRVGSDTSDVAKLDIQFMPEVTIIGVQEQFVIKGRQLLLTCQYDAFPPLNEIQWKKDGTMVTRNESVEINDSRLTIPHYSQSQVQLSINTTTPLDTGNYTCLVINDVGSSSDTTSIIIQVEPNPPMNVAVDSKTSRVVNISWIVGFDGNSGILNYTVNISQDNQEFRDAACQGSTLKCSCVVTSTTASFKNLLPWTTYYFKVFARNMVGISDGSSVLNTTTDEEVPSQAPSYFSLTAKTSTSIELSWQLPPEDSRNGIITGFKLFYKMKPSSGPSSQITINSGSILTKAVTGLDKYTEYEFEVLAFTSVGDGPKSSVLSERTKEDEPDGAPQNVRGQNSSSTSILVMWDEVPADERNGIITGYTITYRSQTENDNGTVQVNDHVRQTELTNLKEYVNYNITVFASTVKGDGPASDPFIVVRTDQDKPAGAPVNVTGHKSSSSSIFVQWNEVPAADQNGVILTYTITYQSLTMKHNGTVTVNYPALQKNVTHLQDYTDYSIRVYASTKKGNGPASDPIVVITDQEEQPVITVQPQAQEKTEGDNVTLSCRADGNPVPIISWTINGSPIDVRGNSRISFSKNKHQLTIRDVKRTDRGAYRCVASNKFGNVTSDAASLDIQCNENPMLIQLPNVAKALALLILQSILSCVLLTVFL